jgi:hypothetical protein
MLLVLMVLMIIILLVIAIVMSSRLLQDTATETSIVIDIDIVFEWEVTVVEGRVLNRRCRHYRVSYLGSNQFKRRIRRLDCGVVMGYRVD